MNLKVLSLFIIHLFVTSNLIVAQECNTSIKFSKEEFQSIKRMASSSSRQTTFGLNIFVESSVPNGDVVSELEINRFVQVANEAFSSTGMHFDICNIISIGDFSSWRLTKYFSPDASWDNDFRGEFTTPNSIDIVFSERLFFDNAAAACHCTGNDDDFIIVHKKTKNGKLTSLAAFPHELGHYFGLNHTHGSEGGDDGVTDEYVSRVPGIQNCDSAGDGFCDTPADPGLTGRVDTSNCSFVCENYNECLKDSKGDYYYPDIYNMMSYGYGCRDNFSNEQDNFMNNYSAIYRTSLTTCSFEPICQDYLYEPSDLANPYLNVLGAPISTSRHSKIKGIIKTINDDDSYHFQFNRLLFNSDGRLALILRTPANANYKLILWELDSNGSKTKIDEVGGFESIVLNKQFGIEQYIVQVIPNGTYNCEEPYTLSVIFKDSNSTDCIDSTEPNNSIFSASTSNEYGFGIAQKSTVINGCIDSADKDYYKFIFTKKGILHFTSFNRIDLELFDSNNQSISHKNDLNGIKSIQIDNSLVVFLEISKIEAPDNEPYVLDLLWTPNTVGGGDNEGNEGLDCSNAIIYDPSIHSSYCFEEGGNQNEKYCNSSLNYPGNEIVYEYHHTLGPDGNTDPISVDLRTNSPFVEVFIVSDCDPNHCIPVNIDYYLSFEKLNNLPGGYENNILIKTKQSLGSGNYYIIVEEKVASTSCGEVQIISGEFVFISFFDCSDNKIGIDVLSIQCLGEFEKKISFEIKYDTEDILDYSLSFDGGQLLNSNQNRYNVVFNENVEQLKIDIQFFDSNGNNCNYIYSVPDFKCPCENEIEEPILPNGHTYLICEGSENIFISTYSENSLSEEYQTLWFKENDLLNPIFTGATFTPSIDGVYYVIHSKNECISNYVQFRVNSSSLDYEFETSNATDPYSIDGKISLTNSSQDIETLDFFWSNGTVTPDIDFVGQGTYYVYIRDKYGCEYVDSTIIDIMYTDMDQDNVNSSIDCDDTNPNINPNQTEIPYNGLDDDCDETTLDDDLDQDGYFISEDCDDDNNGIYPGANEIPNNGIDEDCNGEDLVTSTENSTIKSISIYPNPGINNFVIYSPVITVGYIYNLDGILVLELKLNQGNNDITLTSFPNGVYLLRTIESPFIKIIKL